LKFDGGQQEAGMAQKRPSPPSFLTVNCADLMPPTRHCPTLIHSGTGGTTVTWQQIAKETYSKASAEDAFPEVERQAVLSPENEQPVHHRNQ
jgi:hypothetical protein